MSQRSSYGNGNGHEAPRRPADFLAPIARRVDQKPMVGTSYGKAEERRLTIARDIIIEGSIKGCARLTVEGEAKVELEGCSTLEVTESGTFRGKATVETAEVRGVVDGELTVEGRLLIKSSGKVSGTIRYVDVQIEPGGRLSGNVDTIEAPAQAKPQGDPMIVPRIMLASNSQSQVSAPQDMLELTEEASGNERD